MRLRVYERAVPCALLSLLFSLLLDPSTSRSLLSYIFGPSCRVLILSLTLATLRFFSSFRSSDANTLTLSGMAAAATRLSFPLTRTVLLEFIVDPVGRVAVSF